MRKGFVPAAMILVAVVGVAIIAGLAVGGWLAEIEINVNVQETHKTDTTGTVLRNFYTLDNADDFNSKTPYFTVHESLGIRVSNVRDESLTISLLETVGKQMVVRPDSNDCFTIYIINENTLTLEDPSKLKAMDCSNPKFAAENFIALPYHPNRDITKLIALVRK